MASYKPAYLYGGTIISGSALCEILIKNNNLVQVFTTTANGESELAVIPRQNTVIDGVNVIYFKRLTKDHSHFSPTLLKAVWRQAKTFDVVHIHAWWNTVSVLSALICLLNRVPVIVSPRGMLSGYSFNNRNSFYKNCIHLLLGRALLNRSNIHATSSYENTALQRLINPKAFYNIPNFIDLPVDSASSKNQVNGTLKLFFLSRIEEKKGLDILLNALAKVTIPYHLTIAGTGEPEYITSLQALVAHNQITAHISWIGFQKEHKFELLMAHDVMVLPSHDENFGNVVIESLSAGTAVLISDQVGLAPFVKENELGWVCQTNANSVTTAINDIFNNRNNLKRIADKAPAVIAANFGEAKLLHEYMKMYNTVITS
jgi:glycosyltransferase involved in cell wall biosynthesis